MGKNKRDEGEDKTNKCGEGQKHQAVEFLIEGGKLLNEPFDIDFVGFDGLVEKLVIGIVSSFDLFQA